MGVLQHAISTHTHTHTVTLARLHHECAAAMDAAARAARYLRSNDVLEGSSRAHAMWKAYDSDEGVEVAMHMLPLRGGARRGGALELGVAPLQAVHVPHHLLQKRGRVGALGVRHHAP